MAALVDHRVLDVAFLRQPRRQLARCHAAGEHHLRAIGHAGAAAQREAGALAQRLCLRRVLIRRRLHLLAQQRRVGLELDDHPRLRGAGGGGWRGRRARRRCLPTQRGQQSHGGNNGQQGVVHGTTPVGRVRRDRTSVAATAWSQMRSLEARDVCQRVPPHGCSGKALLPEPVSRHAAQKRKKPRAGLLWTARSGVVARVQRSVTSQSRAPSRAPCSNSPIRCRTRRRP